MNVKMRWGYQMMRGQMQSSDRLAPSPSSKRSGVGGPGMREYLRFGLERKGKPDLKAAIGVQYQFTRGPRPRYVKRQAFAGEAAIVRAQLAVEARGKGTRLCGFLPPGIDGHENDLECQTGFG